MSFRLPNVRPLAGHDVAVAQQEYPSGAAASHLVGALVRRWPILAGQALLVVCCIVILRAANAMNTGHLIYALDDPYIQMAMAKNIVRHGVYGVTQYETTAASSSILWPWLLAACYRVAGVNVYIPYLLNLAACLGEVALAGHILRQARTRPAAAAVEAVGLLLLVLMTPLPTLCQVGMEHSAHCLAMLGLFYYGARLLEEPTKRTYLVRTALLAAAAASLRYETVFLVAALCIALAAARQVRQTVTIAISGLAPVVMYGVVAVLHGQYFFPNSVLVKTVGKTDDGLAGHILSVWTQAPLVPLVGILAAALAWISARRRVEYGWVWYLLVLVAVVCALHIGAIGVYYFFRYQAYLIATGVVALFCYVCRTIELSPQPELRPAWVWAAAAAAIAALWPANMLDTTEAASNNIYRQQYQDAQFVKARYDHGTVLLNDIGAVGFYTDAHIIDYVGLASKDFAAMQIEHRRTAAAFTDYVDAHRPDVGIVYLMWMPGIDRHWIVAANREVIPNVVCADTNVAFLAFRPQDAASIAAAVRSYFTRTDPDSLRGRT